MKIATVGVHVLDTHVIGIESIPDGSDGQLVETIRFSPAGTAGGTAVVLSRLGAEVHSFGAVGEDPIADEPARAARRARASTSSGLVRKADQQTSSSVIPVRPNGDRPAWHCIGANGAFTLDDLDLSAPRRHHPPAPRRSGVPRRRGGRQAARPRALDRRDHLARHPGAGRPGHAGVDRRRAARTPTTCCPTTSRCSASPAPRRWPRARAALVEQGVGCVAVTQGSKGALVVTAEETIEVPAYDIDVVDTTGCGDAFSAGFLRGLSLGLDLRGCRRARLRDRCPGGAGARAPTRGSTPSTASRTSRAPPARRA